MAHPKRKPAARRVSGHGGTGRAQRNAAALGRAKKHRPQRRPARPRARAPRSPPRRAPAAPDGAGGAPLAIRVAEAPFARGARARANGILDALLHGQGWIVLIGLLLAGIVFFNVDLLQMNRDIARHREAGRRGQARQLAAAPGARAAGLERAHPARGRRARPACFPPPGDVRYLRVEPGAATAARAAQRWSSAPGSQSARRSGGPGGDRAARSGCSARDHGAARRDRRTPPATTTPPAATTPQQATPPTAAVPPAGTGAGTTGSPAG